MFSLTKIIDDMALNSDCLKIHSSESAEKLRELIAEQSREQRAKTQIDALVIFAELSPLSLYQIPSHGVI